MAASGIVFENASAHANNQPVPSAYVRELAAVARERGVPLHVDGARFWNTVVALDEDPRELAGPADSLTFCLSKGLACPVGSVLVGSKDFIWRARRARKLLGGGMRQVGILVAAGPLSAGHRSADGSDVPMPDPCEVAPVLPFCR